MRTNPIKLFSNWYVEELQSSKDLVPSSCCLSTVGLDGYPNARFVSLKDIKDDSLIITGSLNTRKGSEIDICSKVALTFWWTSTQRQVRMQGEATLLPPEVSDTYFGERPLEAQIISIISKQGQTLDDIKSLQLMFDNFERPVINKALTRPADWGGFSIKPVRIEFMEFKKNRFHERVLFQRDRKGWITQQLQP